MDDLFGIPDDIIQFMLEDPVFTLEQEKRFRNVMQISKLMGIITNTLEQYSSLGNKICSAFDELCRCLSEMDDITHDDSYSSLKGILDIINGGFQCHFDTIKNQIQTDITNFINKDFSQLQKFHDEHKKTVETYHTVQEKYVAMSRKEMDVSTSEQQLVESHSLNAISFFDYSKKMQSIELQFQILIPSILTNFINSICDPMKFVLRSVDGSKTSIDKCTTRLADFTKRLKEFNVHAAQTKQQLTYHLPNFWQIIRSPFPGTKSRTMQGWLWKKCGRFSVSWKRRFFIIQDCVLTYGKTVENFDKKPQDISLLFASVRQDPNAARPHCFTIQTKERSYTFQALTDWDMKRWLAVIQNNILTQLNGSSSNAPELQGRGIRRHSSGSVMLNRHSLSLNLTTAPAPISIDDSACGSVTPDFVNAFGDDLMEEEIENYTCADCGAHNASWISMNLGISLCDSCAGIHRGLPSKISRVRGITLDSIDEYVKLMIEAIGSQRANRVLEHQLDQSQKINPNSPQNERQEFIKRKYCEHKYIRNDKINIMDAIQNEDIDHTLEWVASGKMDQCMQENTFSPLHAAAIVGNPIIFQLILYATENKMDMLDDKDMTPINYAAAHGNVTIVEFLLRQGAKVFGVSQIDAYSIAMMRGHTDCQQLLEFLCPFNDLGGFVPPHPEIKPVTFDINKFIDSARIEARKSNAFKKRQNKLHRDASIADKDKLLSVIGSIKEANQNKRSSKELPHIDLIASLSMEDM